MTTRLRWLETLCNKVHNANIESQDVSLVSETLNLTKDLISRRSVTPDDAGCQAFLAKRLNAAGFDCEHLRFGKVDNLWARRGTEAPLFVFAGHTDVVPPGPLEDWQSDPFEPVIKDGKLYGRGAADMKSGLSAMVVACEQFVSEHPEHRGSIGFLITSDEEGRALDGTRRVIQNLQERRIHIDWCLLGEPSCDKRVGDTLRRGRRGSLTGDLTVKGRQGHVAYPGKADNPIHRALPVLAKLAEARWDQGHESFPPTSFQISNFNAGTGADNVIPGSARIQFNFRYSPAVSADELQTRFEQMLKRHGLDFELDWHHSGAPFYTENGPLLEVVTAVVEKIAGITPALSTAGGTSDGRFIAPAGAQVVELGPVNASIHQVNEWVDVDELETLAAMYQLVLEKLLL